MNIDSFLIFALCFYIPFYPMEFGKFYFKETDFYVMNCNNTVTRQKSLHMTINKYYLTTILDTFHFVVYKDHSCLFHLF